MNVIRHLAIHSHADVKNAAHVIDNNLKLQHPSESFAVRPFRRSPALEIGGSPAVIATARRLCDIYNTRISAAVTRNATNV